MTLDVDDVSPAAVSVPPGSGPEGFIRLPWGRRCTWIPSDNKDAATAGLCLYPASKRLGMAAQRVTWLAARTFGPKVIPGRRVAWAPALPPGTWESLLREWAVALGGFDSIAIYSRPQESRSGCSVVLVRDKRPAAFVKLRSAGSALEVEHAVLSAFNEDPAGSFRCPRPLAAGVLDSWHWLALDPLPPVPHRPAHPVSTAPMVEEIQQVLHDVLQQVLPKPAETAADWAPMHGDLTPWNLRTLRNEHWLIDWEDAGWGPPDADDTYYRAVSATLYGRPAGTASSDTVEFWLCRVDKRPSSDEDARLNERLMQVLRRMDAS